MRVQYTGAETTQAFLRTMATMEFVQLPSTATSICEVWNGWEQPFTLMRWANDFGIDHRRRVGALAQLLKDRIAIQSEAGQAALQALLHFAWDFGSMSWDATCVAVKGVSDSKEYRLLNDALDGGYHGEIVSRVATRHDPVACDIIREWIPAEIVLRTIKAWAAEGAVLR